MNTSRRFNQMFHQLRVLCGLLLAVVGTSVVAADEQVDSEGMEFFEKNVRPLLVAHCYDCHSGEEQQGGLQLDSRDGLLHGGDSGAAAVPKDADASLIIQAVRYTNRELQMPPENRLSDAEIAILEEWVRRGLPDPRSKAVEAGPPTGMSLDEGKQFWSMQPIADPAVPEVQHADWVQTPVDAFVLHRLEEAGLRPAPQADRRTLIRRVTFNLTGLPPTAQEIDDFLNDESEDAWSKVIERLLASPQYGVRWGRHWLDVARYADSNGLDENLAYGHAWRYRDYVVDAFNSDKPFDRFLIEQLAGDLVPGANQETRTATGFLSLGAKVLAEPDMEKLVMDTVDEQIDTTGKAFLGMTLGCVRCHDHKFDPVRQSDYYALAAIFKSSRTFAETRTGVIKHWYEHSFATDEEKESLKKIDAEIAAKKSAASSYRTKAIGRIRAEARAKAADYLAAAVAVTSNAPLSRFAEVAAERGLHPRILHHCRTHLEFHRYDRVFETWHDLKSRGADAVHEYYQPLFAEAEAAWAQAVKADPKVKALQDERLEVVRSALSDPSGFLAVPPKVEFAFDDATLQEYYRLEEEARVLESHAPDAAAAMGVSEQETLATLPIHIRGSHLNLGEPVAREFPEVMRVSNVRPVFPKGQSGRLELARWMAGTQHPLTARVITNRIWNWHFGQGIVASTENFGKLGSRPTHPELLDWLARHLMESGWSIKELHRVILSSAVYQTAVRHPDEQQGLDADPENQLLWRFRLQRLDAEQLRDSLLAVSGRLDASLGGKTVPLRNRQFVFNHTSRDHTKYDSVRRSIYVPVIRNNLYSLFEQFDFPDPTMPTGRRNETVIAPQALLLMNSGLVVDCAQAMAAELVGSTMSEQDRVSHAYLKALGRPATVAETTRALAFLEDTGFVTVTATGPDEQDRVRAWALLCQSLFASNEFMYVR